MRKRMLVIAMAAIVGVSAFPIAWASAKVSITRTSRNDDSEEDEEYEEYGEYDEEVIGDVIDDPEPEICKELTEGDVVATPSKKTIKVGSSFAIDLYPSDEIEEEYADLSDEEWEDLLEENIDSITYRSSRSSVASVSKTGKVKGRKKGKAIIKIIIAFADSTESIYKTRVYVTR